MKSTSHQLTLKYQTFRIWASINENPDFSPDGRHPCQISRPVETMPEQDQDGGITADSGRISCLTSSLTWDNSKQVPLSSCHSIFIICAMSLCYCNYSCISRTPTFVLKSGRIVYPVYKSHINIDNQKRPNILLIFINIDIIIYR